MSQLVEGAGRRQESLCVGFLAVAVMILLIACSPSNGGRDDRLSVVATIYPLQYFAGQIGGDRVRVTGLVPPGVEAHDWEPSPQSIATIEKARMFVYNGAGFEPWIDRALQNVSSKKLTVVDATEGLQLREFSEGEEAGETDPHVWLDPHMAKGQVAVIRAALQKLNPANSALFQSNADRLSAQLDELDWKLAAGLQDCRRKDFIVAHEAFGYLAARYGLRDHAIAGVSPDVEPSPSQLARLVTEAKAHGATHIFFESLVNPALSQAIAREINAQTLVLNPLESLTEEEASAGATYFTIMEENLKNLQTALGCKGG